VIRPRALHRRAEEGLARSVYLTVLAHLGRAHIGIARHLCPAKAVPLHDARGTPRLRSGPAVHARPDLLTGLAEAVGGQLVQGSKSPSSRGTWMWMSKRSISGPEMRFW
jgi:hypothetical protein